MTIKPVGFLVVKGDSIRLLSVDHHNTYDKIIDTVPQYLIWLKTYLKMDT